MTRIYLSYTQNTLYADEHTTQAAMALTTMTFT